MMFDTVIHTSHFKNEENIKNEIFELMEHSYEYSTEIKKLKNISMEFLMDGFTNWLPEIAEHMCNKLHKAQIYSNKNFEINPYPISLFLTLGVDKSTKQKCFDGIINKVSENKDKCLKLLNLCIYATLYLGIDDLQEDDWNCFVNSGYDFLQILN